MICEDDEVEEAAILPPAQVDELSDCEHIDDNDLLTNDKMPSDVAGVIEVQYKADGKLDTNDEPQHKRRRRATKDTETLCQTRRSRRTRKPNTRFVSNSDGEVQSMPNVER